MKFQDIRKFAKARGIKTGNLKKPELIRTIQRAEGNFDCYGSAISGYCDQLNCLWRKDCLLFSGISLEDRAGISTRRSHARTSA